MADAQAGRGQGGPLPLEKEEGEAAAILAPSSPVTATATASAPQTQTHHARKQREATSTRTSSSASHDSDDRHLKSDPEPAAAAAFTNVALEGDSDSDGDSGDDDRDYQLERRREDERQRRRQEMETEQLDPKERAAHEADTLPVGADRDNAQVHGDVGRKATAVAGAQFWKRLDGLTDWAKVRKNPLPPDPCRADLIKHALRCPPHGVIASSLSRMLLPVVLWVACFAALGPIARPPDGTIFLLVVLVVSGIVFGELVALVRLPPLLGMLIMGIVLKNIPGITFQDDWPAWSSSLRSLALTIILMRAGLGLDPQALKRLSGQLL